MRKSYIERRSDIDVCQKCGLARIEHYSVGHNFLSSYWARTLVVTEQGRRALAMAELFGTQPDDGTVAQ